MKKPIESGAEAVVDVEEITAAPLKDDEITKPADDGGFCAYIGPSIPGVIQTGTIYAGTLEDVNALLDSVISRFPLVAKLLVSGTTLSEDRIKVKTPGNLLHAYYNKLAAERP